MDKKKLKIAIDKLLEGEKGKRKFPQSFELILNFRGIDFSKPENRLNLDIVLPAGRGGKEHKVVLIADETINAKDAGAELHIIPDKIGEFSKEKNLKMITKESIFLAQPNLMAQVAKSLGKFLGPRGKMPKPLIGNPKDAIERAKRSVKIASKGKYLPVAQAFIGTENMDAEKIRENAESVYESVKGKVGQSAIKSIYIKTTMGKALRVA
ncbi:50S ribosomal protein L1 [Candidatus Micrarchaeota archaeon]|nr:50S ribosomal protein L1 [Candidatus Micrarchaeota archaeon]